MFKIYQIYLIKKFLVKFLNLIIIFTSLTIIMSILEEISFFKDLDEKFFYPYLLTLLNTPITLFEIFPFIFILTTQFFFYELFKSQEIHILKQNGLNNLKIIKIMFVISLVVGILNIVIFYNFAALLKFQYFQIKNSFSNDNKYLAMVTSSGLWIKDEINEKKMIIKSALIENNELKETIISEFDQDFKLLRVIQSENINIRSENWLISNPVLTVNNSTQMISGEINYLTNFNSEKINNLFSNIQTYNIIELINLKKNFNRLGYSSNEIKIQLLKLGTIPLFYGMLTVLSSVIMLNFLNYGSLIKLIIMGITLSAVIYYINFIFNSLGANGTIPIYLSIFFPLIFIFLISLIGLVRINEK
jgi:lipopolysaccharide export system permease protein